MAKKIEAEVDETQEVEQPEHDKAQAQAIVNSYEGVKYESEPLALVEAKKALKIK